MAAGPAGVFQLHSDGTIWSYNGTPNDWTKLDSNTNASAIQVGSDGKLYELHNDHSVWVYTGTPITGWTQVSADAGTTTVTAGESSSTHI